ncbi:MAG TPA: ECF-type sigma factor [Bryobacteraceae bacterium]|nr:ECF-type sigma factor [Bryobacteraceae bacterium]
MLTKPPVIGLDSSDDPDRVSSNDFIDNEAPSDLKAQDLATQQLVQLLYPELKRIAQIHMRKERFDHTWQPTALVSEAFLKLARQPGIEWRDRSHFLMAASKAMRFLLIDHARTHRAGKNGGKMLKIQVDDLDLPHEDRTVEYIAVDRSLRKMATVDKRMADVVELKVFGGLSFIEIGEVLGVHERTAKRDWQVARAWLFGELRGGDDHDGRGVGTH